jgi:hypothetical protein
MFGKQVHQESGNTMRGTTAARAARGRRYASIAGGLAVVGALLASLSGFGAANAATRGAAVSSTTGPTVYEQGAYNQGVAIAAGNVHTFVTSSPVLPVGHYLVNSVISFNNLTAGSQVLCGWSTPTSTDHLVGNYGDAQNEDVTANTGSCTVTGIAEINSTNDHLMLWATVYSGPAGPSAYSWSMNETKVGRLVVRSLT